MTFKAKAEYYPINAVVPINFGVCIGSTLDEAMAYLLDDIREFMRKEESIDWWDDVLVIVDHDHVKTSYPFDYWAKRFGWSF